MVHDTPLITIGITCYNASETIGRAIESAQKQDWEYLEIVIIDDASTDHSKDVIGQKIATDPRCRLISQPYNQGVAMARNKILEAARGDFIAFFDDDDQSHPQRVSMQYKKIHEIEFQSGHFAVACYTGVRRHYPNGYTPEFRAIGSQGAPVSGKDLIAYQLHLPTRSKIKTFWGSGTPALCLMIRTKVLQEIGGFDPALHRYEDAEMAIRLALHSGIFVGCPDYLVDQYPTGGSDKAPKKTLESELYILKKYKAILVAEKQYQFAQLWAYMRYHYYRRAWFQLTIIIVLMGCLHPWKAWERFIRVGPARMRHESRIK
jgi:glycosyltransferase involved in cell wall biosynthesis